MKKLLEDILFTGLGTLVVTKEKAEEIVEKMINQGDVTREEGKELLDRFIERTEAETSKISDNFIKNIKKRLSKAGFVTREELDELNSRLDKLEKQIEELN